MIFEKCLFKLFKNIFFFCKNDKNISHFNFVVYVISTLINWLMWGIFIIFGLICTNKYSYIWAILASQASESK